MSRAVTVPVWSHRPTSGPCQDTSIHVRQKCTIARRRAPQQRFVQAARDHAVAEPFFVVVVVDVLAGLVDEMEDVVGGLLPEQGRALPDSGLGLATSPAPRQGEHRHAEGPSATMSACCRIRGPGDSSPKTPGQSDVETRSLLYAGIRTGASAAFSRRPRYSQPSGVGCTWSVPDRKMSALPSPTIDDSSPVPFTHCDGF